MSWPINVLIAFIDAPGEELTEDEWKVAVAQLGALKSVLQLTEWPNFGRWPAGARDVNVLYDEAYSCCATFRTRGAPDGEWIDYLRSTFGALRFSLVTHFM